MPFSPSLLESYRGKVLKAIAHLEYSYQKVGALTASPAAMDEETLATWESFTARFSRVVDLYLTKYIRAAVLKNDPGFQGTLRDCVDFAEKLRLVDNATMWMELRGFRNLIAHEYEENELERNFLDLRALTPQVLAIKAKL